MIVNDDTSEIIRGWAHEDMERWPSFPASKFRDACSHYDAYHSVYAFDIDRHRVSMREKPYGYPTLTSRAEIYLRHLRDVLSYEPLDDRVTLLLDTDDLAVDRPDYPIFSFQRKIGSKNLLLPDLDTLANRGYGDVLPDKYSWDSKCDGAIFVGSTTGAHITREHLDQPFPRLRAARFFRNNPAVRFELPTVVQVEDADVAASLRAEGLGDRAVNWSEQLQYKLLLSMDGNGAALSRPFISLASNSVLVKYASDFEAWYFRYLVPGIHYIPVERDEDVLDLVDGDMDRHEIIARSGRAFAERYLSLAMHRVYTAHLLRIYEERYRAEAVLFLVSYCPRRMLHHGGHSYELSVLSCRISWSRADQRL